MAKGQAAVETVALLAGALFIMIAMITLLPEQAAGIGAQNGIMTATISANRLADEAAQVYLGGDGAQKSVWIELPETYDSAKSFLGSNSAGTSWALNKTVGIYITGYGHVFAESVAPMCGELPNRSGRFLVPIVYNSTGHVMINKTSC